ncbi:efflux RND transporter periplasmic adaptor subunit [Mesorhizobium sp. AD1-1]|uniref:efflux RND transporter periplasmic adaptor subunit n=1 Tax=Mesorhizobium sp. AD1-1 TaxID=2876621 RepID=UPI001CCB9B04|nr:efflux RND transporter periplasmic adaptor subunit [Mesorhizobium sp. AD1-1]MBZ9719198.1 efflux RND transporter periplasmic adaptor subunit [Mesorhizobium sp. AD1-1]
MRAAAIFALFRVAAVLSLFVVPALYSRFMESPAAQPALHNASKPATLTVTVAAVEEHRIDEAVLATGTVVAWEELQVAAETAGLAITEVLVGEGDHVEKGQLLARLNDVQLLAQMEQQKASVAEAKANLEAAQAELGRAQQLLERNATSRQNADQRATAEKTAAARLAVAEAGLVQLHAQLARASIRAPASGYVSKKSAVLGQVVQTGAELFRIVRDSRLEVEAKVPEGDLFEVIRGGQVAVTGPAGRTIEGEIRAVAPIVDPRTRLGTVHVALPSDSGLLPGMFARVEITTRRRVPLAIPEKALVWRNGGKAVFAVQEGTVSLRPVETGVRRGGWIEIVSGLAPGERIAVKGAGFLRNGDRVHVELATADGAEVGR